MSGTFHYLEHYAYQGYSFKFTLTFHATYNEKAHGYWLLASANNTVVKKSLGAQTFTLNNDAFKKIQLKDVSYKIL